MTLDSGELRTFESGATRDTGDGKLDYEGFFSPLVWERFAKYMSKHQVQSDGLLRDSDNWQKGMPLDSYMKSAWRHFMDWWLEHRGSESREGLEEALCGLLFNVQGYLHETLKAAAVQEGVELVLPAPCDKCGVTTETVYWDQHTERFVCGGCC